MIATSPKPQRAAAVAKPERNECAPESPASPAPATRDLTISPIAHGDKLAPIVPWRSMLRKRLPSVSSAAVSQSLHRAHRTLRRLRRERRGDVFSFAFLVALRAADRDDSALALEHQVADLERGELAAPQRSRPNDEDERAIAKAPQIVGNSRKNNQERIAQERGFPLLRDAEFPAVSAFDVAHDAVYGRWIKDRGFMVDPDRRKFAGDRGGPAASGGKVGDVKCDRLRLGQ